MNELLPKTKQIILQFGCRIPLKTEFKPTEREALKALLQETDSDLFQIIEINPAATGNSQGFLFSVSRQYPIGTAMATGLSFSFSPDAIAFYVLTMIGDKFLSSYDTLQASALNRKMRDLFFRLPEVIKGLRYTRTGKIFELLFGPYTPDEKPSILKGIVANPQREIAALKIEVTRVAHSRKDLNIFTILQFNQLKLEDPFYIAIKVDINNRNMESSLEPRDVDEIWKEADNLIEPHLQDLLMSG